MKHLARAQKTLGEACETDPTDVSFERRVIGYSCIKNTRIRNSFIFLSLRLLSSALRLATQENEIAQIEIVMKIFVKTLKGTHFEIQVKPEDTVCFFSSTFFIIIIFSLV